MQLWEKDLIDLDNDIKAYLPDGFFEDSKYATLITMTHLMNHNTGFEDVYVNAAVQDDKYIGSLEE